MLFGTPNVDIISLLSFYTAKPYYSRCKREEIVGPYNNAVYPVSCGDGTQGTAIAVMVGKKCRGHCRPASVKYTQLLLQAKVAR